MKKYCILCNNIDYNKICCCLFLYRDALWFHRITNLKIFHFKIKILHTLGSGNIKFCSVDNIVWNNIISADSMCFLHSHESIQIDYIIYIDAMYSSDLHFHRNQINFEVNPCN